MTDASDSFIRWQKATREHFTFTSNVVLGLATGLLAFFSERFFEGPGHAGYALLVGGLAIFSLGLSVALAIWCSIYRLRDFRATAQIARHRMKNEPVPPETR